MVLILQIVNQNTKMASESTMDRKINTKFTCCMAERDEYDDPRTIGPHGVSDDNYNDSKLWEKIRRNM